MSAMHETPLPGSAEAAEPIEPDQSLSELLGRMTTDVGNLVSTQIELAKVEIKEEVSQAGKGFGVVGGGGLAGYFSVLVISFAAAYALSNLFDSLGWGFLVVGLVYAAVAAVLVLKGKDQIKSATPVAEHTKETLKEDVAWAKQQRS
ncbi:MAG: phage holin family protein [Acidimicrobiales bacterium]|nr:phage holin family protein [Acidimicrobiales bacterium]